MKLPPLPPAPPWVPTWVPNLDDEASIVRLRRAIWIVLALGFLAFIARGADRPADPAFADATRPRVPIPGLAEVAVALVDAAGTVLEHCVLAAEGEQEHRQGLAAAGELIGYSGVLLRVADPAVPPPPVTGRDVTVPLSLAYFDHGGTLVHAAEVRPCPPDAVECPPVSSPAPFAFVLEVPEGQLAPMGVALGARLEVRGACPA